MGYVKARSVPSLVAVRFARPYTGGGLHNTQTCFPSAPQGVGSGQPKRSYKILPSSADYDERIHFRFYADENRSCHGIRRSERQADSPRHIRTTTSSDGTSLRSTPHLPEERSPTRGADDPLISLLGNWKGHAGWTGICPVGLYELQIL